MSIQRTVELHINDLGEFDGTLNLESYFYTDSQYEAMTDFELVLAQIDSDIETIASDNDEAGRVIINYTITRTD